MSFPLGFLDIDSNLSCIAASYYQKWKETADRNEKSELLDVEGQYILEIQDTELIDIGFLRVEVATNVVHGQDFIELVLSPDFYSHTYTEISVITDRIIDRYSLLREVYYSVNYKVDWSLITDYFDIDYQCFMNVNDFVRLINNLPQEIQYRVYNMKNVIFSLSEIRLILDSKLNLKTTDVANVYIDLSSVLSFQLNKDWFQSKMVDIKTILPNIVFIYKINTTKKITKLVQCLVFLNTANIAKTKIQIRVTQDMHNICRQKLLYWEKDYKNLDIEVIRH